MFCLLFELLVACDARDQVILALRRCDMLDTNIEMFVDDAPVDLFGDANADCTLSDIVDDARATVEVLERHPFDLGRVTFDVDVVAHLIGRQVSGHFYHAALPKRPREHVAGAGPIPKAVRHDLLSVGELYRD